MEKRNLISFNDEKIRFECLKSHNKHEINSHDIKVKIDKRTYKLNLVLK